MLVEPMLADLPFTSGDPVIAFVNGLGGTPLIELYVMYREVQPDPGRARCAGGAVAGRSVYHLPRYGRHLGDAAQGRRDLLSLWDAPVNTPALRWGI